MAVLLLGFRPWSLDRPIHWFCGWAEQKVGWSLSIEKARWIPLRNLELTNIRLQTPQGGQLYLVRVSIHPTYSSVIRGFFATEWDIGEIRMNPGSWGIRKSVAQELLSSGPVTIHGSAFVRFYPRKFSFSMLSLEGPMLRLQGQGWITRDEQVSLLLGGALSTRLLVGMDLFHPSDQLRNGIWEPFEVQMNGEIRHLNLEFASNFLSLSSRPYGENKP